MNIVFFGSSEFGIPSLEALLAQPDMSLVHVVSQPDRPVGRRGVLTPTPVMAWAQQHHIPATAYDSLKSPAATSAVAAWNPDLLLVAAYGLIIPASILSLTPDRALNIHGSLLPEYRGASPIQQALLDGRDMTGLTLMQMTPGLDDGPIIARWPIAIGPDDTTPTLTTKLALLAAEHIVEAIRQHAAHPQATAQDNSRSSMTRKIRRDDGHVIWDDAQRVLRMMRAYTPWPGCWAMLSGKRILLERAIADSSSIGQPAGTIIAHHGGWAIVCQNGLVVPNVIKLEGRRSQPAGSFLHDHPDLIGQRLE